LERFLLFGGETSQDERVGGFHLFFHADANAQPPERPATEVVDHGLDASVSCGTALPL
jgi:hypothetical protein